jgi:hypothetical protein
MLKGQCLCEGVKIEIDAALGPVIACHCSQCRRSTGSAFNPNASVPADRYRMRRPMLVMAFWQQADLFLCNSIMQTPIVLRPAQYFERRR